ncbi:hypothetical protein [Dyadobacter frigoris]|uniref:ParA family protein n=1 Tax=Dyadobacter frigoris TaxID=2576211 RepID=A0A4U6D7C2_9BACT|nr:hypothetical protein [Dyadobacter frigoris]TKT92656.1 hypothetical protein FDK13_07525 [Dyadobacter frigoris]
MKKFNFITQSKGGVGKSLLMYLFALKYGHKKDILFVDLDSSTESSKKQLSFIDRDNFDMVSLNDDRDVLVRDLLVGYLEEVSESRYETVYFDLGSPESAQLPFLIRDDIPMKEFADDSGFEMIFHVVIGGGPAYQSSVNYLEQIRAAVGDDFKIIVWKSITSFRGFGVLAQELEERCAKAGLTLRQFGDFVPTTAQGGQILDGARLGWGLDNYSRGTRFSLKRQLQIDIKDE